MSAILDSVKGFQDGAFADLIVRTEDGSRTFKLHRVLVCPQSTTFKDICLNSENVNAPAMMYTLSKEHDPNIFEKLVQFWYTGNYQDEDHYPPLIDVPDSAWSMSPRELKAALEPSGEISEVYSMFDFTKRGSFSDDTDGNQKGELEEPGEVEGQGKEVNQTAVESEDDTSEDDTSEDDTSEDDTSEDDTSDGDTSEGVEEDGIEGDGEVNEENKENKEDENQELENTPTTTALLTSLRVFAMAQHFGVPSLKLVAKSRFYRCMERHLVTDFTSPEFSACVEEMYGSTDVKVDLTLLKEILVACIFPIINTDLSEDLLLIMTRHGELAVQILKYTVQVQAKQRRLGLL